MGAETMVPTRTQRATRGFMVGCFIGLAAGGIIGGISCLRAGIRGREFINETAKAMTTMAGSFGVFMAIGSVVRS